MLEMERGSGGGAPSRDIFHAQRNAKRSADILVRPVLETRCLVRRTRMSALRRGVGLKHG